MKIKGRTINFFSVIGGLLLLSCLLVLRQDEQVEAYFYSVAIVFVCGAAVTLIGFLDIKKLNIINLVIGLGVSWLGAYGTYSVLTNIGSNSMEAVMLAYILAASGALTLTGALIALFRKQPIRFEFDSIEG